MGFVLNIVILYYVLLIFILIIIIVDDVDLLNDYIIIVMFFFVSNLNSYHDYDDLMKESLMTLMYFLLRLFIVIGFLE